MTAIGSTRLHVAYRRLSAAGDGKVPVGRRYRRGYVRRAVIRAVRAADNADDASGRPAFRSLHRNADDRLIATGREPSASGRPASLSSRFAALTADQDRKDFQPHVAPARQGCERRDAAHAGGRRRHRRRHRRRRRRGLLLAQERAFRRAGRKRADRGRAVQPQLGLVPPAEPRPAGAAADDAQHGALGRTATGRSAPIWASAAAA